MGTTTEYELGRHEERKRTMQLIGSVRMDAQTCAQGDVLDKLVMCIASEPLPDARALAPTAQCEWTLVEEVKDEHTNLYRSECGIMLTRRQEWWKFCQLCGKEIKG